MRGTNPVFRRVHTNTSAGVSELELLKRGIQGQLAEQEAARQKSQTAQRPSAATERFSTSRQSIDHVHASGGLSKAEQGDHVGRHAATAAVERPSTTRQLVDELRAAGGSNRAEPGEQLGCQTYLTSVNEAMHTDQSVGNMAPDEDEKESSVQDPAWAQKDEIAGLFAMHEQPCFCTMCNPAISYPLKVSKSAVPCSGLSNGLDMMCLPPAIVCLYCIVLCALTHQTD